MGVENAAVTRRTLFRERGGDDKEKSNTLLEFLIAQMITDPSTSANEVNEHMESFLESKKENVIMYFGRRTPIRYFE